MKACCTVVMPQWIGKRKTASSFSECDVCVNNFPIKQIGHLSMFTKHKVK